MYPPEGMATSRVLEPAGGASTCGSRCWFVWPCCLRRFRRRKRMKRGKCRAVSFSKPGSSAANSVACPGHYVGISGRVAGPVSLYGMVEYYRCADIAGSANRIGASVLLGRSGWVVRPALRASSSTSETGPTIRTSCSSRWAGTFPSEPRRRSQRRRVRCSGADKSRNGGWTAFPQGIAGSVATRGVRGQGCANTPAPEPVAGPRTAGFLPSWLKRPVRHGRTGGDAERRCRASGWTGGRVRIVGGTKCALAPHVVCALQYGSKLSAAHWLAKPRRSDSTDAWCPPRPEACYSARVVAGRCLGRNGS